MKSDEKQILLADSHYLASRSMQLLLLENFQPCRITVAESRYELEKALAGSGSLLILDLSLPDLDGITDLQQLLANAAKIPVMVLTTLLNRTELNQLNNAGIRNILYKTASHDELVEAVEAALKGRKYYGQEVMDLLMDQPDVRKLPMENTSLTGSEMEIIRLIAEGMTTKEIASRKNISFHTVMTHRKNIFRKARVNNASELVMFAIRNGIIESLDYQI